MVTVEGVGVICSHQPEEYIGGRDGAILAAAGASATFAGSPSLSATPSAGLIALEEHCVPPNMLAEWERMMGNPYPAKSRGALMAIETDRLATMDRIGVEMMSFPSPCRARRGRRIPRPPRFTPNQAMMSSRRACRAGQTASPLLAPSPCRMSMAPAGNLNGPCRSSG